MNENIAETKEKKILFKGQEFGKSRRQRGACLWTALNVAAGTGAHSYTHRT